jgi:hypothetical protein
MLRKKPKTGEKAERENDLWINPRFALKGVDGERAWDIRVTGAKQQPLP